ncbi:MOSC domain-containing protein [Niallia nealsonii]|uniref:MOSC domain-containing protein n=1 Tax=Niallia nealsonii TaxID=115979 RepID=A0A2N0Z2T5_9BACI|nr:MOSC domain-containing protein [Niallia nealsonii]PKG23807.1 MOSC domain-containing protein [Niallia nealsonii]
MGNIVALSIGQPEELSWQEKKYVSAIGKTIKQSAQLTEDCFVGDGVANPAFHGGPERAVCFYPYEHYAAWEKEFQTELAIPAFGENICATGYVEKETYIGDIFSLGDAIVQVTQGRIPCSTISKYNHINMFLKRIMETCYTGYFLKVVKEGQVDANSSFTLLERKQSEISVWDATNLMLLDKENKKKIEKVLLLEDLALDWRNRFEKALQKIKK